MPFFRETEIVKKYIGEMIGVSKYTEDNTSTAFVLADGIRVYHFDQFVVWYRKLRTISRILFKLKGRKKCKQ